MTCFRCGRWACVCSPVREPIPPGHVGVTDPPPVPLHGPTTCTEHGPTVTVTWTSGDVCPVCGAYATAREARVAEGEAMLVIESAETRLGALREALEAAATSLETLTRAGGRGGSETLADLIDVRGYAASRARAARAALGDT